MFITIKGQEVSISLIRNFRKIYDSSSQLQYYMLEYLNGDSLRIELNDAGVREAETSGEFGHTAYGLFNLGTVARVSESDYVKDGVNLGITKINYIFPVESSIQFIGKEQEKVAGLKALVDNYVSGSTGTGPGTVGMIPGSIFEMVSSATLPTNCIKLNGNALTPVQQADSRIPISIRAFSHLPNTLTKYTLGDNSLNFIEMVKVLYLGE